MEGKKVYGFAEVAKHRDKEDCWLIISGKVYDVTPYMEEHPGGDEVLLAVAGKDCTADFEDIGHSKAAKETMSRYCIGDIDPCTLPAKRVADGELGARREAGAGAGLWLTVLRIAVPMVLLGIALAIRRLTMVKEY